MQRRTDAGASFVEVFPVHSGSLPTLTAYATVVSGSERSAVGGKLAYRLRREFGGHWVWTGGRIVTESPCTDDALKSVVESLWQEQPDTYRDLRSVQRDGRWKPSLQAQADFAARGLFGDIKLDLLRLLSEQARDLGPARIERVYDVRGWVVDGKPSVSLSVASRLVLKQDLAEFAGSVTHDEDLIGLWVGDKQSTGKGEVVEVIGPLADHRQRLISISQQEETQETLRSSPDNEPVVRVVFGRNEYDYTASALRIILRTSEFSRFGIRASVATQALRIEPRNRADVVGLVANLAKQRRLIGDSYSSQSHPSLFLNADVLGFQPALKFGNGQVRPYNERDTLSNLRRYGLYRPASLHEEEGTIRMGLMQGTRHAGDNFFSQLVSQLRQLGFEARLSSSVRVASLSRAEIETAVGELVGGGADIVIALLPEDVNEDEEEWGAYHNFKSVTVGRGIPSQVVYETTLDRQYALANITMGILGKTGSVPFVLAEPLPYADMVVGLDIARERKRRLAGSLNATAVARIYFGDGQLLRYVIHDAPLEGETIPAHVLQGLFPMQEFRDKRVVIHRDGYFRGDEKRVLREWARSLDAEFYLAEVLKTGTPRLYAQSAGGITQPRKGTLFRLSDWEGFLVSTLPPFRNATPQPLHIRTESPFTVDQAAHSVLSMTLLHYGSLRPPKLPVSIHYSDRIAYLALRGIKPRELEGTIPYWL